MRERLRWGIPGAVLLAITVAVFWEAIFTGRTFFSQDLFHLYYPIKLFLRESFLSGDLPLWNPHIYCGVPFLGDYISSVFYPLNICFLVLPMGWAFKAFIVGHYFLAALFGYLYHRSRGGSWEAGLLVGIAFGFSGYLVSMHNNLIYLQTGIWTPLLLLFALRARRDWGWGGAAALVLGIQLLGGDLQGALLAGGLAALACLLLPEKDASLGLPSPRRRALAVLCIFAGGIGLAAIQWLPAWAWSMASPRGGGVGYAEAAEWSLHPVQLVEMVAPGVLGDRFGHTFWATSVANSRFGYPWAHAVTVGVIPLFLAAWVVFARRRGREVLLWGGVGLVSLVLALGSHVNIYWLVHAVPGLDIFRYPAKFFYLTTLSLALLSGIALDRLRARVEERVGTLRTAFLAGAVVCMLAFGSLLVFRTGALDFFQGATLEVGGIDALGAMQTVAVGLLRASFVLGMLTILLHLRMEGGIREARFILALIVLAGLELTILHAGTRMTAPPDLYARTPPTVEAVRSVGMDGYRFAREQGSYFPYPEMEYRFRFRENPERKQRFFADSLQANLGIVYGLDDALGYSPAEPPRLLKFLQALRENHLRKYSLLGVRAFVAVNGIESREIPLHRLRLVADRSGERFAVLENPAALPRAMLFSRGIEVPSEEAALEALGEPELDPKEVVILEGGAGKVDFGPGERRLEWGATGNGAATFEVIADVESFLLWNESWAAGWEATLDGEPIPIRRANYLMKAVRVPVGTHTVAFRYRPPSFQTGSTISLVSLVILAVLVMIPRIRRRRAEAGTEAAGG